MNNTKTKNMILTALFAALTAVLAQIVLPFGPIPFNLAVLGAYMAGVMLPPAAASASMLIYLLLGAVGMPVFAGFASGPSVLLGKTGGYAIGYIAIALFTAFACKMRFNLLITGLFMGLGLFVCYALGTVWFMAISELSLAKSLAYCVYPFIIPDILKAVFAFTLGTAIKNRLNKS